MARRPRRTLKERVKRLRNPHHCSGCNKDFKGLLMFNGHKCMDAGRYLSDKTARKMGKAKNELRKHAMRMRMAAGLSNEWGKATAKSMSRPVLKGHLKVKDLRHAHKHGLSHDKAEAKSAKHTRRASKSDARAAKHSGKTTPAGKITSRLPRKITGKLSAHHQGRAKRHAIRADIRRGQAAAARHEHSVRYPQRKPAARPPQANGHVNGRANGHSNGRTRTSAKTGRTRT